MGLSCKFPLIQSIEKTIIQWHGMTWYECCHCPSGLSRSPFREGDALNFVSKPESLVISGDVSFTRNRTSRGSGGNWISGNNNGYSTGYNTAAITLSLASGLTMETPAGLADEDLEIKALMGIGQLLRTLSYCYHIVIMTWWWRSSSLGNSWMV